jgi:phenylpropionate dioxygenase-like ring-hydroxylating dioxygenase large terminal subunit
MSESLRNRDGALIDNWYIACLSRELSSSQPLHRILYDQPFVLYRDKESEAVCFPDVCLHRNAQLSRGVVIDGCIACPYHGWTYDSSGTVIDVPSEGPEGKKPHTHLQLKKIPVVEQDGCVWIWLGDSEPKTALLPFRFPHQNDPGWHHYFMITDFDNEVTHLAENFVDVPHTVYVHSKWFRTVQDSRVPIKVDVENGSVLVTYDHAQDKIGFAKWVLNPKGEPTTHTDRFILPNITRVDYGFGSKNGFIIISQITPVSTLKCRVYTAIIYHVGVLGLPMKPFLRYYTRQVIEQDVRIMAIQGENLKRNIQGDFRGTDADVVHTAIERLRDWARQGKAEAFTEKKSLEKVIWI